MRQVTPLVPKELLVGRSIRLDETKSILTRPPSALLAPFCGEGFPTKIDYRKKGYQLILTSLPEDLVVQAVCLLRSRMGHSKDFVTLKPGPKGLRVQIAGPGQKWWVDLGLPSKPTKDPSNKCWWVGLGRAWGRLREGFWSLFVVFCLG